MRITSKIMQNNSLSNINTNKTLQDKLNTQMATEKKINRPSDDPVVAIRALRLRTNVSQVTQYYSKNAPDADSWLKVTEDALSTVSEVITDMIKQCTSGANEKLTSQDRVTILDALKSLRDEVYATGNADYAGRSVFTGYRTESTLKFISDTQKTYSITEHLTTDNIDTIKHVSVGELNSINDANFNSGGLENIVEQDVQTTDVHRIRLAYSDVEAAYKDGQVPTLTYYDEATGSYVPVQVSFTTDADGDGVADDADGDGVADVTTQTMDAITITSIDAAQNPYEEIANNPNGALLIKETGELLLGANVYDALMSKKDNVNTTFDESSILISYQKTNWEKDDLKPEHYFTCTDMSADDPADYVTYNAAYIVPGEEVEKQVIEYDIGMNQTIRVNTTADEVFTHAIGRDVDDLINVMQSVIDMENTVAKLKNMSENESYTPDELETINKQLDAANKALSALMEKAQKMFESGITKMQGHLDMANLAVTNCGTRSKKLELITTRLMSQKTNFETLESENENVDITEVAIQLSSAELTYEAALMATGKIMKTSLMDYI